MSETSRPSTHQPPPMFNVPAIVLGLITLLIAVHGARLLLDEAMDLEVLKQLAFVPARYDGLAEGASFFPPNDPARWWTPLSYALLHADWQHVIVNSLWLLVFGAPVAWRFGAARFSVFLCACIIAGAGAHYLMRPHDFVAVIGASGGVSGLTAAASRFVFEIGGPLSQMRYPGRRTFLVPAAPLLEVLRNPRAFAFVGIWFALNLFYGLGALPTGAEEGVTVAWEAHIGGFLAGLALFPLFDPVPRRGPLGEG